MADDSLEELIKQLGTPIKKHEERSVEQIICDVLDATEHGNKDGRQE